MRALIFMGILSVCVGGVAVAETPIERPLPWLGFGADGGLVILEELPDFEVPDGVDYEDFVAPALEAWLGASARVVAVDPRPYISFFVRAAPGPSDTRVGQRFEVIGSTGQCVVEVTGAVRAALSFFEGFHYDEDGWPSHVYKGPGLRATPSITAVKDDEDVIRWEPEVVLPEQLASNYSTSHRFVGLVTRPVSGTCPLDGLVGAVGQFVRASIRPGDASLADAVRQQFRGNRWIKKITREYLTETKLYPSALAACVAPQKAPKFLDAFATGFRTTLIEAEGAPPYLIAATGSAIGPCDPSRAAIGYTQVGKRWKPSRELWGHEVTSLMVELAVYAPKTKLIWVFASLDRPGSDGWERVVTALNKSGLRRQYGGWPSSAAHFCNYDSTHWEYAQMCAWPDEE